MADALLESPVDHSEFDLDGGQDEREAFAAFASDDETRATLHGLIELMNWPGAALEAGGLADAVRTYGVLPPPARLVVDLHDCEDPVQDFVMLRDVVGDDTVVVALGVVNDVALYRGLIEAGAADYLVKPLNADALRASFERAERVPVAVEAKAQQLGRLILVIGARGGIGASTIAVNSAWAIAHEHGERTALVDLDLQFGTISLALDLEPGNGLREALESPDRVDELFLDRAMVAESEDFFVLGTEESLDTPPDYETEAVVGLLDDLRSRFSDVVVDLPRLMAAGQREIIHAAEQVVLVTDLSLVALRDTLRIKRLVEGCGPGRRITVVANRVGARGDAQLSLNDYEKGLNAKVDFAVPSEEKIAAKAANIGQPIVKMAKRSKAGRVLLTLADALCETEEQAVANKPRKKFSRKKS
jgi:pilus assembly protein CpaE